MRPFGELDKQPVLIGLVSIAIISHSLHEHTEFVVFFILI